MVRLAFATTALAVCPGRGLDASGGDAILGGERDGFAGQPLGSGATHH
jgi:hypothetical protein